jgi:hypothetical protein
VLFCPTLKLTTKKGEFLSCTRNKSRFIKELSGYQTTKGFKTTHADGDANLLIVAAILASKSRKSVVIGEGNFKMYFCK